VSPIPRSDQAEVIEWNDGDLAEWCATCGMGHRKDFCPRLRKWSVQLVREQLGLHGQPTTAYRQIGTVMARSALEAMRLAVAEFGHRVETRRQRIAVDTDGYIRTMWDRLLDNELGI